MAVEKLKLISIIGPIGDFDRVVMEHVIDHDIHIEDVLTVMQNVRGLYPFSDPNPYVEAMKQATECAHLAGMEPSETGKGPYDMDPEQAKQYCVDLSNSINALKERQKKLTDQIEEDGHIIKQLEPIKDAQIRLEEVFHFKYVKVRFGSMPRDSYAKMEQFLGEYEALFFKFDEDQNDVYGVYFAPSVMEEKIDSIFSSLYFKRDRISDKVNGIPKEELARLIKETDELKAKRNEADGELRMIIEKERPKLATALRSIRYKYEAFDVRKNAAHTRETFYIAGWIAEDKAEELQKEFEGDENVTLIVESPDMVKNMTPPTKLKNSWFVRPFEGFVKMYGLPSYGEIDPTPLMAFTYSLMFGAMYGDVGHGLVLALVGLVMKLRKNFLGGILVICGLVSSVFGLIYGSVFGYEDLLPYHIFRPMGSSSNMMTTLIMAVALGAVIITVTMLYNIANGIKQKDLGRVLFSSNGLAGFIFYWAVIFGALALIMGHNVLKWWYIVLFVVVPLILVFLAEPLSKLVARRKDWMPKNKGAFFLESFFELFELLLSYITNTISFIRVGAFALNHAGMMAVVFTLAGATKGSGNMLVIVLGNIVVLGLEGLLVAIQVLRLQFYEMFSRFYTGGGRPFQSSKLQ